jgi:hypothetical protein
LILRRVIELSGTPDEMSELLGILVRECGCGCSYTARELANPAPGCAAVRMLRKRRFVLGMVFARRLRVNSRQRNGRTRRSRAVGGPQGERAPDCLVAQRPALFAQHGVRRPTGGTT